MILALNGYIGVGKDEVARMIQFLSLMSPSKRDFGIYQGRTWTIYGEQDRHWKVKKFAGKLKECASLLTGIPVADFEKPEVKNSLLGPEWNSFEWIGDKLFVEAGEQPMTVRTLLHRLGAEVIRDRVHQNAWVNALFADYQPIGDNLLEGEVRRVREEDLIYPNWVISDCRFPNEAQAVKDRDGIVVRINRPYTTAAGGNGIPATFSRNQFHSSERSLDNWEFDYVLDNSGSLEDLLEKVRTMLLHFKIIQ